MYVYVYIYSYSLVWFQLSSTSHTSEFLCYHHHYYRCYLINLTLLMLVMLFLINKTSFKITAKQMTLCVQELNILHLLFSFFVYRDLSQSADHRCLCQEALCNDSVKTLQLLIVSLSKTHTLKNCVQL